MSDESLGFETRQIHAGADPDPTTGARAMPIYQTTSYVFRDTAHGEALFGLAEPGNIYTRIMNPTQARCSRSAWPTSRVASARWPRPAARRRDPGHPHPGRRRRTTSCRRPSLYGGTYNLFHYTLPKLGIEVSFVEDPDDLDTWETAIRPNTRAFYGETIGNPKGDVLDIPGIAEVAHRNQLPLIVDNTLATPYLATPLAHGADIVVHSATKFIGGHGTAIGGVIVDGGGFDFLASGKHPGFAEPDPSYHGLEYWKMLGPGAFIAKARVQGLRDIGMAVSPFNAFLFIQGLETLSLRMERHVANAQRVAEYLEGRDEVTWVAYPGLPSSPWHERARQLLPRGARVDPVVRHQGRRGRSGRAFVDALDPAQPAGQRGRRPQPGHPPGDHHPLAAERGRAGDDRRDPRPGAPVGGPRDDRRHPGRPRRGFAAAKG